MKKILLVLIAVLLLATGCTTKKISDNKFPNQNNRSGKTGMGQMFDLTDQQKGTIEDLVLNKKVMIFGTPNADGSITATRIMFGEFDKLTPKRENSATTGQQNQDTVKQQFPKEADFPQMGDNEFRPDFRGEKMNGEAQRQPSSGAFAQKGKIKNNGMAIGEIITKDKDFFVLKMKDGGSKIIFFSDKTEIYIIKAPETTTEKPATTPTDAPTTIPPTTENK